MSVIYKALPYLLVIALGLAWTVLVYRVGGNAEGDAVRLEWQTERNANARAVLNALERTLDAQRELGERLAARDLTHQQELQDVEDQYQRFMDGVRSGAVRVSIPVHAPTCKPASDAGAAVAGQPAQTRAELMPEAAAALAAIVRDGDSGILDLNACIDRYNDVRAATEALNHAEAR